MTGLACHSVGTVEGSHSPASVVMPRNTALTATVTCDPGTIAVNGTTKAGLLAYAKGALELGERSLRDAAEALSRAQDNHGATQREMAKAVGMPIGWVNRLLKWRQAGYKDASPSGPTTRQARVQHAEQEHRRHRSEKNVDADHRTNAQDCTAAGPTEADAPAITNSACSAVPVQKKRSPSESDPGVQVCNQPVVATARRSGPNRNCLILQREDKAEGVTNIPKPAPPGTDDIPSWPKLTESGFPVTSGVTGNYRHGNKPQKRSNSSAHRHGGQR